MINGGVSKFNILAHRLGFRPDGESTVRMAQMGHYDTPSLFSMPNFGWFGFAE
jgi:hypothetical protein